MTASPATTTREDVEKYPQKMLMLRTMRAVMNCTSLPFEDPLPQDALNLEDKNRTSIFAWRGQFSPQLVENLLKAYCPPRASILDPFCGSGTVLHETGRLNARAWGYELNPAAHILSKTYEFINVRHTKRARVLQDFRTKVTRCFPNFPALEILGATNITVNDLTHFISAFILSATAQENSLLQAFIILLDVYRNTLTSRHILFTLSKLINTIKNYPFSESEIIAQMGDARSLELGNSEIDLVVTSPPYINVFNYHQNYRASAELLGWDLLEIARSEIGSNRANRQNRFYTVVQYCVDMAATLREMQRVCKTGAKLIFIVGHESNVLRVPFYNAQIFSDFASSSGCFDLVLRQKRQFKNKFGKIIWEDLLHMVNKSACIPVKQWEEIAKDTALTMLQNGLQVVSADNRPDLEEAIGRLPTLKGTPIYKIYDELGHTHSTAISHVGMR